MVSCCVHDFLLEVGGYVGRCNRGRPDQPVLQYIKEPVEVIVDEIEAGEEGREVECAEFSFEVDRVNGIDFVMDVWDGCWVSPGFHSSPDVESRSSISWSNVSVFLVVLYPPQYMGIVTWTSPEFSFRLARRLSVWPVAWSL